MRARGGDAERRGGGPVPLCSRGSSLSRARGRTWRGPGTRTRGSHGPGAGDGAMRAESARTAPPESRISECEAVRILTPPPLSISHARTELLHLPLPRAVRFRVHTESAPPGKRRGSGPGCGPAAASEAPAVQPAGGSRLRLVHPPGCGGRGPAVAARAAVVIGRRRGRPGTRPPRRFIHGIRLHLTDSGSVGTLDPQDFTWFPDTTPVIPMVLCSPILRHRRNVSQA